MKREIVGFLVTVALACLAMGAFILAFGCGDGPDLRKLDASASAIVTAGCGEGAAPDAGADADPCQCPPGGEVVVLPACGKVCGLE